MNKLLLAAELWAMDADFEALLSSYEEMWNTRSASAQILHLAEKMIMD